MKRVNKVSAAGIAAFAIGALLTGCGGGGSGSGTGTGSAVGGGGYIDEKTAVLSWSAPMTRENGDSISMGELEKYVIRYGKDVEDMSEEVVINNAQSEAEMSYAINGLENGTWYFTIQVQDTSGVISAPSDVVSKSIQS
ncbi:fibronectin type III domain-containing protein [Marinobacter arenosus]|uniref:fibronectin type III domain-containing protein n=1 Tax=Marinobacter arenosus TaxID=2856822 RepID=UPI001E394433|nr:fibronectin type III domain-containing protein [Marinobacter arenosus]